MNTPNFGAVLAVMRNQWTDDRDLTARKVRESDLNAANAMHDARIETVQAVAVINALPQLLEADVLVLLHALQRRIEGGGNMHCEHWRSLCDELASHQSYLQDVIAHGAEWERL